jgi:hypothetical protein
MSVRRRVIEPQYSVLYSAFWCTRPFEKYATFFRPNVFWRDMFRPNVPIPRKRTRNSISCFALSSLHKHVNTKFLLSIRPCATSNKTFPVRRTISQNFFCNSMYWIARLIVTQVHKVKVKAKKNMYTSCIFLCRIGKHVNRPYFKIHTFVFCMSITNNVMANVLKTHSA